MNDGPDEFNYAAEQRRIRDTQRVDRTLLAIALVFLAIALASHFGWREERPRHLIEDRLRPDPLDDAP